MKDDFDLKHRKINIVLNASTKQELDELGSRRDSYDDIIRKLIRQYYLNQGKTTAPANYLKITEHKRKKAAISFGKVKISYSFNIPQNYQERGYFFDITYTKIVKDGEALNFNNKYAPPKEMALNYLKIVERIVQKYVDPLFRINKQNRNVFDLSWWQRKFNNLNLTDELFKRDIEDKLINFGVAL